MCPITGSSTYAPITVTHACVPPSGCVSAAMVADLCSHSQSIRPMPRASEQVANIIEQLEAVRANMHELNNKLKQVS